MDELLKNKSFKAKMSSLSSGVKQWFISALVDLFEQETEYVIEVLEDCRFEIGAAANSYADDAKQLRAASRMLEERREASNASYGRTVSSLSVSGERSVRDGIKHRRRRRTCISDTDFRSPSCMSVPSYPMGRSPSPSARGTRSLPVTPQPDAKHLEAETKAILKAMKDADAQVKKERVRQRELVEQVRLQKKELAGDKTRQALELLEKAIEMDRVLTRDKERQVTVLNDKIDKMKLRRNRQAETPTMPASISDVPVIEDLEN